MLGSHRSVTTSPYRIMLADTDPAGYWKYAVEKDPALAQATFAEQMGVRANDFISVADFYAQHLSDLGHDCMVVPLNASLPQLAWAKEYLRSSSLLARGLQLLPTRVVESFLMKIFLAQVDRFDPSVVLILNVHALAPAVVRNLRGAGRLVIGQHAASEVAANHVKPYDLILTSYPPMQRHLSAAGVRVESLRLGFEAEALGRLKARMTRDLVSFVGSFTVVHNERQRFIEDLLELFPNLKVWAPDLPKGATPRLRDAYQGAAWGLEMLEVLQRSVATVNHHGVVGEFANNLRLYEATGVGTALVTDAKSNLGDLFDVGTEVLAYSTASGCAEHLDRLVADPESAETIGEAGQRRTLSEHTWKDRTNELVEILASHV